MRGHLERDLHLGHEAVDCAYRLLPSRVRPPLLFDFELASLLCVVLQDQPHLVQPVLQQFDFFCHHVKLSLSPLSLELIVLQ